MKYILEKEILEKFPDLKVILIRIKNINNTKSGAESYQYLQEVISQFRKNNNFKNVLNKPEYSIWQKVFTNLNISQENNASHIALIKRVLDGQEITDINPMINILNAISIKYRVPIGGHNLNNIKGDISVGKNKDCLSFTLMGKNEAEKVGTDEIVYKDKEKIITRNWVWRQSEFSKVTESVTDVFIPIDLIESNIFDNEKQILNEITNILKTFFPEAEITTDFADKSTHEVELDSLKMISTFQNINFTYIEVKKDKKIIDRVLNKAVEEILPSKEAFEKLLLSGKRIKVYQGFDPTAPTLHIGHTVMMRKLEDLRKLGHEVIMLIGDFTGRIGDPTDKLAARKQLTSEQVKENLRVYQEQASRLLDIYNKENPVKVVFNNDWLGKMSFADVVELASNFTVQQMQKRDMFQKRLQQDQPIYLHEFLYPLMQGYDSVVLDVDVELGGNDQLFNMLAGRHLAMETKKHEKFVLAGKLLTTNDGKKMGKSEGNMIMLSDSANDIYGKVMAFTDGLIINGFELLTNCELEEVEIKRKQIEEGRNPMELKKELAFLITSELKGKEEAEKAKQYFEDIYQKKTVNEEIPTVKVQEKSVIIIDLLVTIGFAKSKSEARRLIEQNAVSINSEKVTDFQKVIEISGEVIVKAGKRICKVYI